VNLKVMMQTCYFPSASGKGEQ
jgi:hypothetical protein